MSNDNNSADDEKLSTVVKQLLKLQCIFMIEKEIETLKNRRVLHEINEYIQKSMVINLNKILVTIVQCFIEKYFNTLKRELKKNLKNVPYLLGGEDVDRGREILDKCLIIIEKRMFEHLYNELDEEPLNYLTIFNMFNLDFVKKEEKYRIFLDKSQIKLEEGHTEERLITVKCINIFDLIKYVYYNAIIDAKKKISQRIFKQFIEDNMIKGYRKGKFVEDPCEKMFKRTKKGKLIDNSRLNNQQITDNKLLNIAEYLIKEMWKCLPDLKNPINLRKDLFTNQMNEITEENENLCKSVEDLDNEFINWNYLVTKDGETLYLNAPTYKSLEEFRPGVPRVYEYKPELTSQDFDRLHNKKETKNMDKCRKLDIFDLKLDAILNEDMSLQREEICTGMVKTKNKKVLKLDAILTEEMPLEKEEICPEIKKTKNQRILSLIKTRNKHKKTSLLKIEIWNQFQKTYFTFEEQETEDKKVKICHSSIKPYEFFDHIPQFSRFTVAPIKSEFDNFKYICAACGYFIPKGTGVEAMGNKWHNEHFECRVCSYGFTEESEFILYRGTVLCTYDANILFDLT